MNINSRKTNLFITRECSILVAKTTRQTYMYYAMLGCLRNPKLFWDQYFAEFLMEIQGTSTASPHTYMHTAAVPVEERIF